jgi:hypothetical protein
MFDKAKLHRDDQKGKQAAKKPHEQPAAQDDKAKAPDLPALGQSGAPLAGGGVGAAADKAENDPAAMAEQQKELQRLKALPAGSPKLEAYKKPEATAAKLPEGAGATGEAKNASKGMAPKVEQQAPATFGAPAQQVSKEPGGLKVETHKTEVYATQPTSGPAQTAVANASSSPAAVQAVTEKAPEAAEAPAKVEVAQVQAEKKEPPAATQLNTVAPASGADVKKPAIEPQKAPAGQPEAVKTGDPSAEARGAAQPEKSPEKAPEKVSPQGQDAPKAEDPKAKDAGPAQDRQVAATPVAKGDAAPAKDAQVGEQAVAVKTVADASVPGELPAQVDKVADAPDKAVAAPSLTAPTGNAQLPTGGEAALAPQAAVDKAPDAKVEAIAEARPTAQGAAPSASQEAAPQAVAASAPSAGTAAPKEAAAAGVANVAAEVASVAEAVGILAPSPGAVPQAEAGASLTLGGAAPKQVRGPQDVEADAVDVKAGAAVAGAASMQVVGDVSVDGTPPALEVPGGDLANEFAGRVAASELSEQVQGLTADRARDQSAQAPNVVPQDAVDAIDKLSGVSGRDPKLEDRTAAAEQQKQIDAALKSQAQGVARKPADALQSLGQDASQAVQQAGQQVQEGARELGEQVVGDVRKKASEGVRSARRQGKGQATLSANPGENVRSQLGQGGKLPDQIRAKAEQATGQSLAGVQLHEGAAAEALADVHDATAFAQGSDIVLGAKAQAMTSQSRDVVLAEEVAHVVQMGGKQAASRSATGVSSSVDKSEKAARSAALKVLQGANVEGLAHEEDVRALYRNDGPAATDAKSDVKMPDKVQLSIGGKSITVNLPKMEGGTAQKMVSLPNFGISGLTMETQANLKFSADGKFTGGTAHGSIAAGKTMTLADQLLTIDQSGSMKSTFPGATLTIGSLVHTTITATVGAGGVTGKGPVQYSELNNAKLNTWLTSGSLSVSVAGDGAATGSGSLGIQLEPFSKGTLAATLANEQVSGAVSISNTNSISLGKSPAVSTGTLTGQLENSAKVSLTGSLKLDIGALGTGKGAVQAAWDSDGQKISGSAAFQGGEANLGKVAFASSQVTGTVADTKLSKVDGTGKATFDNLFEGNWSGSVDLDTDKASFSLGGKLAAPITQGEVTIDKGNVTVQVTDGELKSATGKVDFKLGSWLKGTAVIEEGTTANNVNATATGSLVSAQTFGDVTVSKGSMTVKVRGTTVELISGSVDLQYKDVAKGQLNLTHSGDVRKFNGNAKATLNSGLVWGDIKVLEGAIDLELKENKVEKAGGQMKMAYQDFAEGRMSFDGLKDFTAITGTATAKLTKRKDQVAPLALIPDTGKSFDIAFENSTFKNYQGAFGWQYDKFTGDVTTTGALTDFGAITGKGKADLKEDLPIGEANGKKLMGKPGSVLTGSHEQGRFIGVQGQLKWQYEDWLGGMASIPAPKQSITEIDGILDANVLAPHTLAGTKVVLQAGGSNLKIELRNSTPVRYSGTLAYVFDSFLKGEVTVAGPMLDFTNLAGKSTAQVIAKKQLPNVELQPGGSLNVDFQNSDFNDFTGNPAFIYKSWLKGTAEADAGSSLRNGVLGKATGTLVTAPPGGNGEFKMLPGGDVKTDLVPNTDVKVFDPGSKVNWQYKDWLGGALTISAGTILAPDGKDDGANVKKDHDLAQGPKFTLNPSGGVHVEVAAGAPSKISGTVQASIADWVKGAFVLDASSGVDSMDGNLTGALVKDFPIAGSETTLIAGGTVEVKVLTNTPQSISGTIPFKYGAPDWLKGTVHGQSAAGGTIRSINGEVTASVSSDKKLSGGLTLKPGGSIKTEMKNSAIDKLGGNVGFTAKANTTDDAVGGTLELDASSTTALIGGAFDGSLLKVVDAGVDLKLQPSGGLKGTIGQNLVKTVGGTINWKFSDWLAGNVVAPEGEITRVGGVGDATIQKKVDVVPGHLFLKTGGHLTATLEAGTFKSMSGEAGFEFDQWLDGTVTLTNATKTEIAGEAKGSVLAKGLIMGASPAQVKLLAGGSLTTQLDNTGVKKLSGGANVELNQANSGDVWHVQGKGTLEASDISSYTGTIDGAVKSERKIPPSLVIKTGGSVGGHMVAGAFDSIHGNVNYEYAPGGSLFLKGHLEIAAGSTDTVLSGSMDGVVAKEQVAGKFKIQPGGTLSGSLTNNNKATLGGNLAMTYDDYIKGTVQVDGQIDPNGTPVKVSGRVEATTTGSKTFGKLTILPGSQLGAEAKDSAVEKVWGKLNFSAPDFNTGLLDAAEGAGSTPTSYTGEASVTLKGDKAVGSSGLKIRGGTSLKIGVENNEFTKITGTVQWAYKDWLTGALTVEGDADLKNISGSGTAQIAKRIPVGSTSFAILPGTGIGAKIAGGNLDSVSGQLLWEYGPGGWLGGDVTVPEGTKLDSPSGSGTARVKADKQFGDFTLKSGGALTATIQAGEPTSFGGKVLWAYGADKWLEGDVTIADGSKLEHISGSATATLAKDKQVGGSALILKKGGSLTGTVADNKPESLSGSVNWEYESWLQGKVDVQASSLDTVQGEATATLKTEKLVPGTGLELQKGGSVQVSINASQIKEFGGSLNWKYGEGEKWAKGSVTLAGKSTLDSISGKADAQLIADLPLGDVLVKKEGSNLQVDIANSSIKTFGGSAEYLYDAGRWLHGTVKVDPSSTPKQVSGLATGTVEKAYQVGSSELKIDVGSTAKVTIANNDVKNFGGNLKWTYGADPWLKGTIDVADSSSPKKISGAVTATLSKYKRLSDDVKLEEGGHLKAQFDGTTLKQFDGDVTVDYQDWLQGGLTLTNSNLETVNGKVSGRLRKFKNLSDDLRLVEGGSVNIELASNAIKSFSGDVTWQYAQWLEGNLHVEGGGDLKSITGTGSATLKQQKKVGDKLELQRGGGLQTKISNSAFDGLGGQVAWKYDQWLKGTVTVPPYAKLDTISGTISASLDADKQVGSDVTLKRGGTVTGQLQNSSLSKIGGNVGWKLQDWLGGTVTLNESPLDHLTGKADASLLQRKEVAAPFAVLRGGSMQLDFDTQKSMLDQQFQANLSWEYEKWLGGEVEASGTFAKLAGKGRAVLKTEKVYGDVTLRRGGEARVVIAGSKPESFGGDLNWQYQQWLSGTVAIADGSKLDSITGKGTASVIQDKPVGGQFTLKAGGALEANLAGSKLTTFGGTGYYKYADWIEGSLSVDKGSTLEKVSGKGQGTLSKNYAVGGSEFVIQQGASAEVDVEGSQFKGISGRLKWKYQNWAEGGVEVKGSKLDNIDGTADARVVADKELVGGFKLTPGGSAQVDVQGSKLQKWGGSVNWQYKDLAKGSLSLAGKSDLTSLNGDAQARLIKDVPLGGGDVKLLAGSGITVKVANSSFDKVSGAARFQYKDWLVGSITLQDSDLNSVNGSATAQVIKEYAPGGGQFKLRQGGNLRVDFKNSTFTDIEGEVEWAYDNPKSKMDGRVTIPKSPVTAIAGEGTARLTADTEPVQNTKLLAGGHLSVKVAASRPESFGGRVDWQHQEWIGGFVEVNAGTPVAGPYSGTAGASLKQDKQVGDKFLAKKGGNLNLHLDTAAGLDNTTFDGSLAVDYDHWLRGSLTADAGSSFKQLNGTAQVELIDDKQLGGKVKLLKGGNVQAKFAGSTLTSFGGVVMADYEDWLSGSINVNPASTPDSISGEARLQLKKDKQFGEFKLLAGGQVTLKVTNSTAGTFGGVVDWAYQDWVKGNLTVDAASTFDSIGGAGTAQVTKDKPLGGEVTLVAGGHATVKVAASALKSFGGEVNVKYQDWIEGGVTLNGENTLESISGTAHIHTTKDKEVGGGVTIKQDSSAIGQMLSSKLTTLQGTLNFKWTDFVEGQITLAGGSTVEKITGHASVGLIKDKEVGAGVKLLKGGNAQADFDGQAITHLEGTLNLQYQEWLKGSVIASTGSSLTDISGKGTLTVQQEKKFGAIAIKQGSTLESDFAASKITEFRGNVEVGYEDWLKGSLNFTAQDLNSIQGSGTLQVIADHQLVDPISILNGSGLKVNFEKSALKDFGGTVRLGVREWGKGQVTVKDGSTPKDVSGEGKITLDQPKKLGEYVTLTHADIGASMEHNHIDHIWGRADAEVKDFGKGWVNVAKSSTLTSFDGQAGLKLETPKKIGNFAELSGGEIIANFQANSLKDFGGHVDIKVFGWGKGTVQVDAGSTMDHIKGSASIELTEPKSLAGGKVKITGGKVTAAVDGQQLTRVAGMIEVELLDVVKGKVQGQLDVEKESFSGQGEVQQIKAWKAGPVTISDGRLSAVITDNKLTGASGSAAIDAGRIGKGTFKVNYEDVGGEGVFYGTGDIDFKPHDRVEGKIHVDYSRDKKLTGEGTVRAKISDKITASATVALDEQGHVKLKGSVTVPGPFELFKPAPYKKDMSLLDLSFVVYTPPTVKVKVGAGLGIECGIKPLTLSNVVIGGEVDLMEPSFASMSVTGHLASSAYCDLNAYIQGSVQISAAVVAVEAGLRASLNLHLEAALSADPTITVNRNGLSFDMPIDARLTAALNLILTFFAKVKVGIDVGLFSIMKTVWQYENSPDPLRLAEMSIGAKGNVHAGPDGFRGTMNPEYTPPDLTLDGLKRALHL